MSHINGSHVALRISVLWTKRIVSYTGYGTFLNLNKNQFSVYSNFVTLRSCYNLVVIVTITITLMYDTMIKQCEAGHMKFPNYYNTNIHSDRPSWFVVTATALYSGLELCVVYAVWLGVGQTRNYLVPKIWTAS